MKKTKEGVAGKGKIALDKRAQPTLAQRVAKVLAKTKWREKKTANPCSKGLQFKEMPHLAQRWLAHSWLSLIKGLSFSANLDFF